LVYALSGRVILGDNRVEHSVVRLERCGSYCKHCIISCCWICIATYYSSWV